MKITKKKIKNKLSFWRRLLVCGFAFCLSLGFFLIPFQNSAARTPKAATNEPLANPPATTGKVVVNMEWESGTVVETYASDSQGSYALLAAATNSYRHIQVKASGVSGQTVKARVQTFDVSASASNGDYASIDRELTITIPTGATSATASVEIKTSEQKRFPDDGTGGAVAAITESGSANETTHTRIFGIKIVSVSSNAEIASSRNTLYARTGYNTQLINNNGGAYHLKRNNQMPSGVVVKSDINNGYTYSTVVSSGENITYNKTLVKEWNIDANSSKSVSFYAKDALDGTATSYKNYFKDTELYYTGKFTFTDTLALPTQGANYTITEGNTVRAEMGIDGRNFDNNKINWLKSGYHDTSSHKSEVYKISNRGGGFGDGFQYFIKDNGNKITWKITLRGYGKDVKNNILSTILVNQEKPKIKQISVWDGGTYGYRANDEVKIAVRFSKPVQLARITGENNPLFRKLHLNVNIAGQTFQFPYESGSYTDTLIFSKKLDANISCDTIKVESFGSGDFSDSADWKYLVGDMMLNRNNSNNTADTTGWTNLSSLSGITTTLNCKIDTRTPTIKAHPRNESSYTQLMHTVDVELNNMGADGTLYYAWTKEADSFKVSDSAWRSLESIKVGSGAENYNAISSGYENGKVYLHLRAVSKNGIAIEGYGGQYAFDNTMPTVATNAEVEYALYQKNHTIKFYAKDSEIFDLTQTDNVDVGVGKISLVVQKKKDDGSYEDVAGYTSASPKTVYSVADSIATMKATGTVDDLNDEDMPAGAKRSQYTEYSMTLSHTDVGLAAESWAEYRVGFLVEDTLGNKASYTVDDGTGKQTTQYIFYDNRGLFFDNRNTFKAEIYQATGKQDGLLTGDATHETLPVFYNQVAVSGSNPTTYTPLSMAICSTDEIAPQDTFSLKTVYVDGKIVYNEGAWENGKTYGDYGFNKDPAANVSRDDTAGYVSMKGVVEFNSDACGYYQFIYQKLNGQQSNTVKAYISPLQTQTENYTALYNPNRLLVNRVWQIQTSSYYAQTQTPAKQYYSGRDIRPIFSSRAKAVEFITYMEYQDISITVLTTEQAAQLEANTLSTMRKAVGKSANSPKQPAAKVNQTWLRYKSYTWTVSGQIGTDPDYWVYYHVSDSALTEISVEDMLKNVLLKEAIEDNVNDIVGVETTADLTPTTNFTLTPFSGGETTDGFGQPYYYEGAIYNAARQVEKGAGSIFSETIKYTGDTAIYDSFIDYQIDGKTQSVPLVANYTCASPTYTYLYYRPANATNGAWTLIPNGSTLKQSISSTGLYEIAELNGGYKRYYIYCDFSAPILQYDGEKGEEHLADAKFTSVNHDPNLNSQLTLSSITLKNFLIGEYAIEGWSEEKDEYAYVYIKRSASAGGDSTVKELFYSAYELRQLMAEGGALLPAGTYNVYIYDRLGNCIITKIRTNPTPIVEVDPYEEPDVSINFTINRSADEITLFEITRDGEIVRDTHNGSQVYSFGQSGYYTYRVEDIYGNVYSYPQEPNKLEFIRQPPQVSFAYSNGLRYTNIAITPGGEDPVSTGAVVWQNSEIAYSVSTASDIRITTATYGNYTYSISNPNVQVVKSEDGSRSVYTISYDANETWIFYLSFADDPSPLSTLVISSKEDKEAPTVEVSVDVPEHNYFDVVEDSAGNVVLGNVLFDNTITSPTIRHDAVVSGSRVSGQSLTFTWSDDTEVMSVVYTLNGGAEEYVPKTPNTKVLTEPGKYVFTVSDVLGKKTIYEVELTSSLNFHVETGDKEILHYIDPENHITGTGLNAKWDAPLYTGKDLRIYMQETMTLALLYQTQGTKKLYYIDYYQESLVVTEVFINSGNIDMSTLVSKTLVEGARETLFKDGTLTLNYEFANGVLTLTSPEPTLYEFWQLRFTNRSNNSSPCILQIERSNETPDLILYGERGQLLANGVSYSGINTALELRINTGSIADLDKVIAYRSDVEFYDYSNITDQITLKTGAKLGSITEDGFYIIVATNKYGNEQVMLVRINSQLTIEVRVAYADASLPERIFEDLLVQDEPYKFYSNQEIYLHIWNSELQVELIAGEVTLRFATMEEYRWFSVHETGSFTLRIYDSCQNEYIVQGEIVEDTALDYAEYLVGYNENAVRRADNYTNAPLSLSMENMQSKEVSYAAYRKQGDTTWFALYDVISQYKVDPTGEKFTDCVGKQNGVYEVLFTDKYGNAYIETVRISNEEQIVVRRKIQSTPVEQSVSLFSAIERGAWSNYSITITNYAKQYKFTVNGQEVQFSVDGRYKWELPLTVAEGSQTYDFAYVDEYGNAYEFEIHLYRKVPTVKAAMQAQQVSSAGTLYIKGDFAYTWEGENLTATYTRDAQREQVYHKGQLLTEDGAYSITFTDLAGNTTSAHITRDTEVSCYLLAGGKELPYGITVSSAVRIGTRERDVSISSITRNGESVSAKITDSFSEDGFYVIVLVDKIGNSTELAFEIYSTPSQSFLYTADKGFVISQIWLESGDIRLPYVSDVIVDGLGRQQYNFHIDGEYEIELYHVATNSYSTFNITIDNVAPDVKLVGVEEGGITRKNVNLSGLQVGDIVDVYRNGKLVGTYEYAKSQSFSSIKKAGEYKVVVRDQAGNQVVFEFEREFTTNVAANAMICIFLCGISILGIAFVRGRERIRTK